MLIKKRLMNTKMTKMTRLTANIMRMVWMRMMMRMVYSPGKKVKYYVVQSILPLLPMGHVEQMGNISKWITATSES